MNKTNHNPSPEFNRDREFTVILEDINSKFDLLADSLKDHDAKFNILTEGQAGIINRLDRLEVKVDRLENKVGRLEMKTDVMYKELSGQRTELTAQGIRINGQSADIKEIKNILLSHDKRLANLEGALC